MPDVLRRGAVFEVRQTIVVSHTVLVVDLIAGWAGAFKCPQDQPVNVKVAAGVVAVEQANLNVAFAGVTRNLEGLTPSGVSSAYVAEV
jgi:hypothetical protein